MRDDWHEDRESVARLVEWMLADGYEHWAVVEAVRNPQKFSWVFKEHVREG